MQNINQVTSPKSQNAWPPQKPSPMTQAKDKELASPQQVSQQSGAAPLKQPNAGQNRQSAIPLQMQENFANMSANMAAHVTANTSTSVNEEKMAFLHRQMQIQQRFVPRPQQQNQALSKGSEP